MTAPKHTVDSNPLAGVIQVPSATTSVLTKDSNPLAGVIPLSHTDGKSNRRRFKPPCGGNTDADRVSFRRGARIQTPLRG